MYSMFFGKKREKEIEKITKKLEESHLRQVSKIEKTTEIVSGVNKAIMTGTKIYHITEAIAHATGGDRR